MPRRRFPRPWIVLLLTAPMWLTACESPASSVTTQANPCLLLPLHTYSAATNDTLADEIQGAPSAAQWPRMIGDYVELRDAVRACRGAK